jgi:hypothetical protein
MKRAAVEAASTPTSSTRPTMIPGGAEFERIVPLYLRPAIHYGFKTVR